MSSTITPPVYHRFPVKLFEVRDRATFIPVIAVQLLVRSPDVRAKIGPPDSSPINTQVVDDAQEEWLLLRAGYNRLQIHGQHSEPYVLLAKLEGIQCHYDSYAWDTRTMHVAHDHILKYWDELVSGQVIDVEYILGESSNPKSSERALQRMKR